MSIQQLRTEADRDVGQLGWMLRSCVKIVKMDHGKIFNENL